MSSWQAPLVMSQRDVSAAHVIVSVGTGRHTHCTTRRKVTGFCLVGLARQVYVQLRCKP